MAMLGRRFLGSLSSIGRKLSLSALSRVEISHHNTPLSLIAFRPGTMLSFIDSFNIFF